MANWSNLKSSVSSVIKENGNNEITGKTLQDVLINIISNLGENAQFAGVATPETTPGTPDGEVFYLAGQSGVYSNFSQIILENGEVAVFTWNGSSWAKKTISQPYVNDLTTGGADKALSAEMGKELELNDRLLYGIHSNFNQFLNITIGGISGTGNYTSRTDRARCNGILCTPFDIECNEGYVIQSIAVFKIHNGKLEFINLWAHNKTTFTVGADTELYTIIFAKSDGSDFVEEELGNIVKNYNGKVAQNTGNSRYKIMSQKAVSDELALINKTLSEVENDYVLIKSLGAYELTYGKDILSENGELKGSVFNRAACVDYISVNEKIVISINGDNNLQIRRLYFYKDGVYISSEIVDSKKVTLEKSDLYNQLRLTVSKVDNSEVSPDLIKNTAITVQKNIIAQTTGVNTDLVMSQKAVSGEINRLSSKIEYGDRFSQGIRSELTNTLNISIGGITTDGSLTDRTDRARYKGMLSAPFEVTCNEGYLIKSVCRYKRIGENYIYDTLVAIDSQSTKVVNNSFLYSVLFMKSDASNFSDTELNSIIKEFKSSLSEEEKEEEKEEEVTITTPKLALVGTPSTYISSPTDEDTDIETIKCNSLYEKYDNLCSSHSTWFSRSENIGTDSSGAEIRRYTLRIGAKYSTSELLEDNIWDDNLCPPRTVLMYAGMHGNEKSSVYGMYLFVKDLLESKEEWAMFIKANFILEIIPVVNIWGFDNISRVNYDGVDPNRMFNSANPPLETKAIIDFYTSIKNRIMLVIDSHNCLGRAAYNKTRRDTIFYQTNIAISTQLCALFYDTWKEFPAKPVYCVVDSTSGGTGSWYFGKENKAIVLLETPRDVISGSSTNRIQSCKLVKDQIGNFITYMGAYVASNY